MNLASILCSILLAAVIAWGVKLLNWVWLRPRRLQKLLRKQGLKGNSYRLLLGDMKDLISVMKQEQFKPIQLSDDLVPHMFPYFHQIITKYGENSFIWFGPSPRLIISDPKLMREILARPDIFRKPLPDPIGQTVAGGLLYLEGQKWAKHRKIINPAFHMDKLKSMVPVIGMSCLDMMGKWEALVGGDGGGGEWAVEIDVWPFIEDFSGHVISRVAFGSSHEKGRRIFELQKELVKLVLEVIQFMFIPGWRFVPTKANRRTKAMSEEIRSLLKGIIKQRQKAMESEKKVGSDGDLLGTLMESNREAHGMSIEDVIEECKLFYFAGSETTSLVVVWTLVMLSKHQGWQARAREEVLQVFGERHPSYDGLSRLKIVTMILNEVLRMYPSVPLLARAPTETVKLGDVTVPVGVNLMLLIGAMHHDPKIWGDDVSEFKPERFESGMRGQSGFMPFSSGPRVCIGQNLGMIEAKIAVAMMLQRFSFELSPSYLHMPFSIITLQPQHGVPLLLRKLK
ncbi:hypothetical protein SASPL_144419 [Salvia splendens]|uniref:Cytochrome P450, family 72, subfamily C, polypeptide 1 n=1 Tax=Salvia splendens TaxID=180675 RepID=A0A8X8WFS0_SALSN|nr:cytochrome P450 CYP72A219-like [Salvia splendens]KAG6393845.1 hypothetical protein SASPL_144419 [Salvia splendens]